MDPFYSSSPSSTPTRQPSHFNTPRHAFALATTNTRLLRIFATNLTRIVPDVDYGEDPFHTLTLGHMLSVIRIAGPALRELNLPRSCLSLVKQLPQFCPRLEKIYLLDLGREGLSEIANIFLLPLRSLSIKGASSRTLRLLSRAPEELALIDIEPTNDVRFALKTLLRNLPRKLHISFRSIRPFTDSIRAYLHGICPGVEDFSLKILYGYSRNDEDMSPLSRLMTLLKKPRGNVHSKCRKITLEGDVFEFLERAHTEAHVEITHRGQTFIDSGNGIYPTRITLRDEYLDQDLSRLTDIVIRDDFHDRSWDKRLSGIRLKRVQVEDVCAEYLCRVDIQADVIEVSSKFLIGVTGDDIECGNPGLAGDRYKDIVEWLNCANEIRIFHVWYNCDLNVLFASLARLIDQFPGKVVFLDPGYHSFWIDSFSGPGSDLVKADCIFEALVMLMRRAMDNFEARGGDASTVRSLINAIIAQWN